MPYVIAKFKNRRFYKGMKENLNINKIISIITEGDLIKQALCESLLRG